ncbi:hypothetical protein [Bermanella sp. R86510]|uniref:hypothetical protein n=1 Tax=unclassified Bermanella TaxID=2627862 RepID=UPI0037C8F9F4
MLLFTCECLAFEQQWQIDAGYNWRHEHAFLQDDDRISIRYNIEKEFSNGRIAAHYQLGYLHSEGYIPQGDDRYRVDDLNDYLIESSLSQNLDRLFLQYYFHNADITIGRQAISLGLARFSSNVDVFYPTLIGALQTDYRSGVDAIRFEHMISMDVRGLSLIDGAWLGDQQGYARLRSNIFSTDIQFTHVRLQEDMATSFALDGAYGSVGWWSVVNHLYSEASSVSLHVAQLGMDFSLHDFLYQAEWSQREDEEMNRLNRFIDKGMLPFPDNRYVFLSVTYLSGVRSQFQASVAHNIEKNSQLWSFIYQYSINKYWDAWLQLNTNENLYASSHSNGLSFSDYGHLISVNVKSVF